MLFEHRYMGSSFIGNLDNKTNISFVPDTKRDATYFSGNLIQNIPFREAISALHDVVISDSRYIPKDKSEYIAWAEKQTFIDLEKVAAKSNDIKEEINRKRIELEDVKEKLQVQMKAFNDATRVYREYVWKYDPAVAYIFDPVITVHPDQLFFECFSVDESSYGCLSASHNVFQHLGEFACGTTNIDYSQSLYNEFQKIRSYKNTKFEVDPSGFTVETQHEDAYKEVKIDLPDSWVRGFLQVNSAMTMKHICFDLEPIDIHNICFILRRKRELLGPRSIRYILKPGEPIKILFEPWNETLTCRSVYQGDTEEEVRVWGRRRIHVLERLIPQAKSFKVRLLGTGMPSFYVADLGDMSFTLGLSGWSNNDWSKAANLDLMAPRAETDETTKIAVYNKLKEHRFASLNQLILDLNIDSKHVLSALQTYAQAGRVIYDLQNDVYRSRELTQDPLPMDQLRFSNPREESATRLVAEKKVNINTSGFNRDNNGNTQYKGTVEDKGKKFNTEFTINPDQALISAKCECNYFLMNKLYKGPCEHILALRTYKNRKG